MKKIILIVILLFLCVSFSYGATPFNFLTEPKADTLYCPISGGCGGSGGGKIGNLPYLYNDSITMFFNESRLNKTIDARAGASSDTQKNTDGFYLYNNSATIFFNETQLNTTIDARATSGGNSSQEMVDGVNITGFLKDWRFLVLFPIRPGLYNDTNNIYLNLTFINETIDDKMVTPGITETFANNTYLRLDTENDPLTGTLDMGGNNITNMGEIRATDGSKLTIGTDTIFTDFDQAIILESNQTLGPGVITHALIDQQGGKVIEAWQSGKNNSWGYHRNSEGIFGDQGITNASKLTDAIFMWINYGINPAFDYDTANQGAALGVQYGVETQKLQIHDELNEGSIIGEGVFDWINRVGSHFHIHNGEGLHISKDRVEEIIVGIGPIEIFNIDWDGIPLATQPPTDFTRIDNLAVSNRLWSIRNDLRCFSNPCARSQGFDGGAFKIIEHNFTTINVSDMMVWFYYGSFGMDAGDADSFVVTITNNTDGEVVLFNDTTTSADINPAILKNFSIPSGMNNKSLVSLRFYHRATGVSEASFIDDVIINGTAGSPLNVNVTRKDARIVLGDESCKILVNGSDTSMLIGGDTCGNIEITGNVTFANTIFTNITGNVNATSITLNGTLITDWRGSDHSGNSTQGIIDAANFTGLLINWPDVSGNSTKQFIDGTSSLYVNRTGDFMSGNLDIEKNLSINKFLIINNSIINLSENSIVGDVLCFDGVAWSTTPDPTGPSSSTHLVRSITGKCSWVLPTVSFVPTLSSVLVQGHITNNNNITITDGDAINFGTAETVYMYPQGGNIGVHGNIVFDAGNSLEVPNNEYAFFSEFDNDAGLFFSLTNQAIEGKNTGGVVVFSFDATGFETPAFFRGGLRLGTNGADGLQVGDLNATDLFYDALRPKSAFMIIYDTYYLQIFDAYGWDRGGKTELLVKLNNNFDIVKMEGNQTERIMEEVYNYVGKQKNETLYKIDRLECEDEEYFMYIDYSNWLNGSRECIFQIEIANANCEINYGRHYYYDGRSGECVLNEESYCERIRWQVWRDNDCVVNPQLECLFNQTGKIWDYDNNICIDDGQRLCESQGCGYSWSDNECKFSLRQYNYCKSLECDRGQYWNGDECIDF